MPVTEPVSSPPSPPSSPSSPLPSSLPSSAAPPRSGEQPPRPSLRGQLLVRLLPVVVCLFALSSALSYYGARYYANLVHDRWLQDSAEALAHRITMRQGQLDVDLPEAARAILQWDATDTTWYEVIGTHGHIAGQLGLPRRSNGLGTPGTTQRYDGSVGANPVRVVSVTLVPNDSEEAVQVLVAETLRKRQALATELMLSVLLPEIALLAAAVIVIAWTLRRMLLPIDRVAEALEARTQHSLEPLDDRDLPSEVIPLIHAMNSLLIRLEDALNAQRHFIADAAHQLRTPLTALKLHTDEAARETDPRRLQPLIAELQRAADRAVRLSNQLLTLARAEPSAGLTARQRFDLRETVVVAADHWIPTALAQGVDLGFDGADGAPVDVVGNPLLMVEAVNNLIDNALKYGRPRGRVTVSVGSDAHRAWLSVLDDGPGIPPSERGRVVQRFHRLEPAQLDEAAGGGGTSPVDAPTGSGLGLSIVTEIVHSHGGRIRLDSAPAGRGLLVMVELPLCRNGPAAPAGARTG